MKVKYYYSEKYLTTNMYIGVNSIEKILQKNQYIVVLNESGEYYGLLTINDLIQRPHKLVADCICKIQPVQTEDSIAIAYQNMISTKSYFVPVFEENIFKGILSLDKIAKAFNSYYRHIDYSVSENRQQLNFLKKKAAESDKIKEGFIRNISHEIRTPLNGLVGFSSLISQQINTEENKRYIGYIEDCSTKLLNTIENIIEVSEIQTITKNNEESCKLQSLFYAIRLYMDSEKRKKGKTQISVVLKNSFGEEVLIKKYAGKIKQAVFHLCSNAIKFTETGCIEIGSKKEDQTFILYVKDSGIGIPDKDKQRIFKPFEKVTDENNFSTYPGVGLSLTIAERLIHSAGGEIIVKSAVGKGSIFKIILPYEIISE